MARYLTTAAKRFLLVAGKLVLYLMILHLVVHLAFDVLPDAALNQLGWSAIDPDVLADRRERLNLNGNWIDRYVQHLASMTQGDFGRSRAGGFDIATILVNRLIQTIPLWIVGTALIIVVPIPAASIFCSARQSLLHRGVRFSASILLVPQFLAAVMLNSLWVIWLSQLVPGALQGVTHFLLIVLSCSFLPATMVFQAASNTAAVLAKENFVRTYLAIGMNWWRIRYWITFNLFRLVRPVVVRALMLMFIGCIFAELVFQRPGFGLLFVESLRTGDLPMMQAWVLVVGSLTLAITMLERVEL